MGQVTIYLDSKTEKKLSNLVEKKGISKSKWIAGLIREKTSMVWPEKVIHLAGAWSDLPSAEEIRNSMGTDAEREPM
jgi:hypothetical protein